jgi:hypothetical protein
MLHLSEGLKGSKVCTRSFANDRPYCLHFSHYICSAGTVVLTFTLYVKLPLTYDFIDQFRFNSSAWKYILLKQQAYNQLMTLGEIHLDSEHLTLKWAGKPALFWGNNLMFIAIRYIDENCSNIKFKVHFTGDFIETAFNKAKSIEAYSVL